MSIAFFTDAPYEGLVSRNSPNMRTDQSWICALKATHYSIFGDIKNINKKYDIGIVLIPKDIWREKLASQNFPLITNIKKICNKVLTIQESTHWDWQDDPFNSYIND